MPPRSRARSVADESPVVAVRDEAYLLAVGLAGHGQPGLGGDPADSLLAVLSDWQAEASQLGLREREEHVGLVLPGVGPLEQPVPGAQAPAAARILGVFHRAAPLALRRRGGASSRSTVQRRIVTPMTSPPSC
jgi:hypothetical protein